MNSNRNLCAYFRIYVVRVLQINHCFGFANSHNRRFVRDFNEFGLVSAVIFDL